MIFDKLLNWYHSWRYPKKFKVGDNVRYKGVNYWQNLVITKHDFYYKGWWLYADEYDDNRLGLKWYTGLSFKEEDLELILPEFLPYDPKQQGDCDDDI